MWPELFETQVKTMSFSNGFTQPQVGQAALLSVCELLLQSHEGYVRFFPGITNASVDASFQRLRAVGAFVISDARASGVVSGVTVMSEKGSEFKFAWTKTEVPHVSCNGSPVKVRRLPALGPGDENVFGFATSEGDTCTIHGGGLPTSGFDNVG